MSTPAINLSLFPSDAPCRKPRSYTSSITICFFSLSCSLGSGPEQDWINGDPKKVRTSSMSAWRFGRARPAPASSLLFPPSSLSLLATNGLKTFLFYMGRASCSHWCQAPHAFFFWHAAHSLLSLSEFFGGTLVLPVETATHTPPSPTIIVSRIYLYIESHMVKDGLLERCPAAGAELLLLLGGTEDGRECESQCKIK